MTKHSFSIHDASKYVFETASCRVCNYFRRSLQDGCFLCSLHGPVRSTEACPSFQLSPAEKERHETIINKKKCKNCAFFELSDPGTAEKRDGISEESSLLGICVRYTLREFDGNLRNACSMMQEKTK